MTLSVTQERRAEHPVDLIERLATANQWNFERGDENEITFEVEGSHAALQIAFTWLPEMEALHGACAFDLKVPERRRAAILGLVSLINEQLWVGHFDLWSSDNVVMFRHALLLSGGMEPNARQSEILLKIAVDTCERYFQAFQFVIWADKTPREALDCVMFETVGQA